MQWHSFLETDVINGVFEFLVTLHIKHILHQGEKMISRRALIWSVVCLSIISFTWLLWRLFLPNPRSTSTYQNSPIIESPKKSKPKKVRNNLPAPEQVPIMVSPTFELDAMISKYESDGTRSTREQVDLAESELRWQEWKRQGKTMWGSETWMKEPEYYQKLDTLKLAEECFERPTFGFQMTIYDNPQYGFITLKIMHNGFAELFQREDMWKGILHVYEQLSLELKPENNLGKIIEVSLNLFALHRLYELSEFKGQVRGREELFLRANIEVLKQYSSFIDSFDPEKIGTPTPFFTEPVAVARVALMLHKQVNPSQYDKTEPVIKPIRWSQQQNMSDVKQFIDLVIKQIERAGQN